MKSKILEILRNKDTYVSGQELSERFGVSRTAVWKAIHQLEEEGYRIEAVPRKGYHMVETPDVVCKEEILSLLETKWAGRNLVYLETVDSTNDLAKNWQIRELPRVPWWWPMSRPEEKGAGAAPGVHRKAAPSR